MLILIHSKKANLLANSKFLREFTNDLSNANFRNFTSLRVLVPIEKLPQRPNAYHWHATLFLDTSVPVPQFRANALLSRNSC